MTTTKTEIRETLEAVRVRGRVKRAKSERRCDVCGAAIPAGTRYLLSRAEVRGYRSVRDIGHTHVDFRFCASCHPVEAAR